MKSLEIHLNDNILYAKYLMRAKRWAHQRRLLPGPLILVLQGFSGLGILNQQAPRNDLKNPNRISMVENQGKDGLNRENQRKALHLSKSY